MLKTLDEADRRCLELADHLERDVTDEEVNMANWEQCLAGHAVTYFDKTEDLSGVGGYAIMSRAAELMGVEQRSGMSGLFSFMVYENRGGRVRTRPATREDAVKRLRALVAKRAAGE